MKKALNAALEKGYPKLPLLPVQPSASSAPSQGPAATVPSETPAALAQATAPLHRDPLPCLSPWNLSSLREQRD